MIEAGPHFCLNSWESYLILTRSFCENQLIPNWKNIVKNLNQRYIKSVGAVNMMTGATSKCQLFVCVLFDFEKKFTGI